LRRIRPHNEKNLGAWLFGKDFLQCVDRICRATPANFSVISPQSGNSLNKGIGHFPPHLRW
jgi:hypothetical protein